MDLPVSFWLNIDNLLAIFEGLPSCLMGLSKKNITFRQLCSLWKFGENKKGYSITSITYHISTYQNMFIDKICNLWKFNQWIAPWL